MRHTLLAGLIAAAAILLPGSAAAQAPLPPAPGPSLSGAWTRNADLSDVPPGGDGSQSRGDGSSNGNGGGGNRGGGGGGGGRRRGGGGGGGGYGGGGRGGNTAPPANPDEVARMRDAMRDVMSPPDHFIISQTPTIVVLTAPDGRTVRLAPDGKKVKDENTKVERKTKWDGGKLVSEINGLGPGKMTQTFAVDPEGKQLRITVVTEGGNSKQPRTMTQVYDLDPK